MAARTRQDRGFALLIVLWSLVLLALLLAMVTQGGRADLTHAIAMRDATQSELAADAAVQETIWYLLDGSGNGWDLRNAEHMLHEAGVDVDVQIFDDRGKLDINQAPPALMAGLFVTLGLDREHATDLGQAILDWHTEGPGVDNDPAAGAAYREGGYVYGPPGEQFQTLDELLWVRGMTPQLYLAARPFLTLALEQAPWLDMAPAEVQAAMDWTNRVAKLNIDKADRRGPQIFWVYAHAMGPGHARFFRRELVRLDGTLAGPAWKYRILARENGDDQDLAHLEAMQAADIAVKQ